MKNIKTMTQFLSEALRDTWKETIGSHEMILNVGWSQELHDELSFKSIKIGFVEGIGTDSWENETLEYYLANKNGEKMKRFYQDKNFWTDDNIKKLKVYLESKGLFSELYSFLSTNQKNEKVDIYREILVNDSWINSLLNKKTGEIHLGWYWTYDSGVAESWDGADDDCDIPVLLHAKVLQTDINWVRTYNVNYIVPWEKEISLYPNTPLELLSITIDGQEVDLSNFKNKEIYA